MPEIEVTFDIDANGIVHVSAKDLGTGREQSIRITGGSSLAQEEIDRMIKDAEARNQAESLVHQAEKQLSDHGEALDASTRKQVQAAVGKVDEALNGSDVAAIRQATERLQAQQLGQALYAQQTTQADGTGAGTGQAGGTGSGGASGQQEDVVDAEVVDDEQARRG